MRYESDSNVEKLAGYGVWWVRWLALKWVWSIIATVIFALWMFGTFGSRNLTGSIPTSAPCTERIPSFQTAGDVVKTGRLETQPAPYKGCTAR